MEATVKKPNEDREQRIRELAYSIWDQEGRPGGQAERHWEMARKAVETLELAEVAVAMNADGLSEAGRPIRSETLEAAFDQVRKPDGPKQLPKAGRAPRQTVTRATKSKPRK